MPTSDAQHSRLLPRRRQIVLPTHSIPLSTPQGTDALSDVARHAAQHSTAFSVPLTPPRTSLPMRPSSSSSANKELSEQMVYEQYEQHEHALDFATSSWDLATGGLKTLTAKRELPTRFDRRLTEMPPDSEVVSYARNYMFALIVLICVILMLIGGGVVILVMLQP